MTLASIGKTWTSQVFKPHKEDTWSPCCMFDKLLHSHFKHPRKMPCVMRPNQRRPCWNHWRLTSPKFKSLPLERFPSPKERIVLQPFFFSCYESNFGKKRIQTNKITHKKSQIASVIPKKSGYPKKNVIPKPASGPTKIRLSQSLSLSPESIGSFDGSVDLDHLPGIAPAEDWKVGFYLANLGIPRIINIAPHKAKDDVLFDLDLCFLCVFYLLLFFHHVHL